MKNIFIGIVAAVIIIGGIVALSRRGSDTSLDSMIADTNKGSIESGAMKDKAVAGSGEMMDKKTETGVVEDKSQTKIDGAMMQKSGYEPYAADKIAFAKTGKVVLFFHAPWCPYCRSADADITKNLSAIPSGLLVLKTDYDSSVDLKKKYGVTYQHTFVQVDEKGNMITKWSGSSTLADLVSHLK